MAAIPVRVCARSRIVRAGLSAWLAEDAGVEVVATGDDLLTMATRAGPAAVLVVDCRPDDSGLREVIGALPSSPAVRLVAIVCPADTDLVVRLLRVGARGLLADGCRPDELLAAVQVAEAGDFYLQAAFAEGLAAALDERERVPHSALATLTRRETEVLELVAGGLTNDRVARRLFIEARTVRSHLSSIFRKLGVRSRGEAMVIAHRSGIVTEVPTDVLALGGRGWSAPGVPADAGTRRPPMGW